jgi:cell division septal protein FtsQ
MDRSRRGGTKQARASSDAGVPAASRLTVRGGKKNRRRPGSLWSRLPRPRVVVDACGRALRRSVPALGVTAALTAVGFGLWAGYRFLTTNERFAITAIEITGEQHLTEAQILARLPVRLGDNVFQTDLGEVAAAARALPWVRSAEARRVLPHTIVIDLREHEPAAVVELGELYLVDAKGHPFKRAQLEAGDGAGLPVITGLAREVYEAAPEATAQTIVAALGALATWRSDPGRPAIGELHLDTHRALTLRTYEHATAIQLGPMGPELAARMQTFDAAWGELSQPERLRARAIHVDARIDQVTVALNTKD